MTNPKTSILLSSGLLDSLVSEQSPRAQTLDLNAPSFKPTQDMGRPLRLLLNAGALGPQKKSKVVTAGSPARVTPQKG